MITCSIPSAVAILWRGYDVKGRPAGSTMAQTWIVARDRLMVQSGLGPGQIRVEPAEDAPAQELLAPGPPVSVRTELGGAKTSPIGAVGRADPKNFVVAHGSSGPRQGRPPARRATAETNRTPRGV